jgi:hypothetical protein
MLEHYREGKGNSACGSGHAIERTHLCHANMPNVRIASGIFSGSHDLLSEGSLESDWFQQREFRDE